MCEHQNRAIEEGQSVCRGCGTILEQQIDDGPEWRYYGADDRNDDPCRTGAAPNQLLPDSSYGSMAMNVKCVSPQFKQIIRLSSWALASCSERSWIAALDLLQTYAARAGLTKAILVESCALLKGQEDALKLRGETRRALFGAVFFVACRRNGVSRTHEEIAHIVNVGTRSLCKAIQRFDMQVKIDNPLMMTQLSLAERMMNGVSVSEDQRGEILEAIQRVFKNPEEELEHTPKVMVAGLIASILVKDSSDPRAIVKTFSKQCGVSVVSIQKVISRV
jgi:transcription initiation factor TFIIIB Brf1 subunit/transcription initiation factor TFIIB